MGMELEIIISLQVFESIAVVGLVLSDLVEQVVARVIQVDGGVE